MNAKISLCKIDQEGVFKYIQIECINKQNKEDKKLLIRGDGNCYYHIENYEYECIGGGRIEFRPDSIFIYGYSSGYGQADHSKTKEIVQKFFPNYKIEISDEGY